MKFSVITFNAHFILAQLVSYGCLIVFKLRTDAELVSEA